jgi:peptide methionine sulfoxide reductase MsrA
LFRCLFSQNRKKKSVPDRINLLDFLNNDPKAREQYFNDLKEYRLAIFKCDEETKRLIAEYKKAGLEFFKLDKETKESFVGRNVNQETSEIEFYRSRKVNKGYVHIKNVKEFLKVYHSNV